MGTFSSEHGAGKSLLGDHNFYQDGAHDAARIIAFGGGVIALASEQGEPARFFVLQGQVDLVWLEHKIFSLCTTKGADGRVGGYRHRLSKRICCSDLDGGRAGGGGVVCNRRRPGDCGREGIGRGNGDGGCKGFSRWN